MSDIISNLLIQIKADATSALAAFKNVVTGTTQVTQAAAAAAPATAAVSQAITQAGQAAHTAGGHIAGMSYYFRSFFDSMRFAMLGNPMAAFYMVDEGVRALVASGMGLMPIAGIIGSIGVVVGASFIWWEELGDHMDRDAKKAKDLADALDKIPDAVKRAYDLQKQGAIDAGQRKHIEDILSGAPAQIVGGTKDNPIIEMLHSMITKPKGAFNPLAQAIPVQIGPLGPMNPVERPTGPAPDASQRVAAVTALMDAAAARHQETISKYQVSQGDKEESAQQQKQDIQKQKLSQEAARTQEQTLARLQRARQQELRELDQEAQKQKEADKQHEEDLQRQAQLTRDIQRMAIENQIESTKSNALLTDQEKLAIVSALQAKQEQINNAEISELEKLKSQVKTLSDQLELEKKIAELKGQNQKIDDANTPAQQNSFGQQWGSMLAGQSSKWTGWAQESAGGFAKAWDGATNSVSAGLTHLFEYGAQKGQWFRALWNGMVGSMISSVTQLAVNWVAQHVIMTAAHAVAEQVMTSATAAGGSERGAIRLAETVFHNVLVALRVAAHVAGEALSTAATAIGAAARAVYHAIAAAVGAMESEASVPYVGVILGIAAGAAILAAAYGMMGGFAQGGYTGPGHPSHVAGVVHAGEYVIPASRTSASMNLLRAIHSGALSDAAPMSGAGNLTAPAPRSGSQDGGQVQHITHIGVYHDKAKMVQELQQSDAHEKWVADIQAKNAYKFS